MSICLEKNRTGQIVAVLLTWILAAALLLLAAALLIDRLKLDGKWIGISAAAVIFLSSFAAGFVFCRDMKKGKPWLAALTLWVVASSALLMLGFLIDSDAVSLKGLIRILASCLLGSLAGTLAAGGLSRQKGKKRKRPSRLT